MAERVEKVWRIVHSVPDFYAKLPNSMYAISLVWGILWHHTQAELRKKKILVNLNFLAFFLFKSDLQCHFSKCGSPSVPPFPFSFWFYCCSSMRWKVPDWKLEERVTSVCRSTGGTSKENTTEQSSERKPINLTFLNGSIKNKYIYKMFQRECLVYVVYTLNTYVLHSFLLVLHSSFAV